MNRKFARLSLTILAVLAFALLIAGTVLADTFDANKTLTLHNSTAPEGDDCPDEDGAYWHFVIIPNTDDSVFIVFHLNLGDASTYDTSVYIPNGSQLDNVFVAVPSGKTLESLIASGSTADIYWNGEGREPTEFNLSHICPGEQAQDLTVEKTADASYTRTFEWTIDKSSDRKTVFSAGGGESGAIHFTIDLTKDAGTDSDFVVSGTITVSNSNSFDVNGVDISDSISGGDCSVDDATLDVAANSSASTDYSCTFDSNPGSGTNTATATWPNIGSPNTSDDGTADFTFGDPTTVVNNEIDVTDTNGGSWNFTDSGSVSYDQTYTDPAGTCTPHTNTATITQTGQEASATVFDCQGADLTVEKTAIPSFDLTYAWNIDKAVVGSSSATVDQGQTTTFNYSVTVSYDAGTESNWAVSGTITVSNPNDWQDIVADISDSLPSGNCSVTGGDNVFVPRGDSVTLDYSCTFDGNPGSGTNTATAIWDAEAAHTPNGSASDDADFTFGDPTNVYDECVSVSDSIAGALGTACVGESNPKTFNYSSTFNGPAAGTCADYPNTATSTTNDNGTQDSDSESVRVCSFKAALTPGYWKTHLGSSVRSSPWYDPCRSLPSGTGCSNNGPFANKYLAPNNIKLGNYTVDSILKAAQVFAAMNCSNTGTNAQQNQNAAGCLAGHLLAAKLNVANGANTCIAPVIAQADAFLISIGYSGAGGNYTAIGTVNRNTAISLKNALDAYNNGVGCH